MIYGSIIRSRESRKRNQLPVYPLDTQTTGPWSDPRGLAALSILSDILQKEIFPERDLAWPIYESEQVWPDDMTEDFQEGLLLINSSEWVIKSDWPPPWVSTENRIQDCKDLQLRWLQSSREKELTASIDKYGYYAGGAPHGFTSKIEEITPWEIGYFESKIQNMIKTEQAKIQNIIQAEQSRVEQQSTEQLEYIFGLQRERWDQMYQNTGRRECELSE